MWQIINSVTLGFLGLCALLFAIGFVKGALRYIREHKNIKFSPDGSEEYQP